MDKLYNKQREVMHQISVEHTRKILGGSIGLIFYDVTSLYFETDMKDELRTNGFSHIHQSDKKIVKKRRVG